jgi:hypothetical protein
MTGAAQELFALELLRAPGRCRYLGQPLRTNWSNEMPARPYLDIATTVA